MICAGGHKKGACFVSFLYHLMLLRFGLWFFSSNYMIGVLLCQGDSGGPLTKNGILVGVVSGEMPRVQVVM